MSIQEKLPQFFIVGAPKCGTTSLYEYLSQHPDIFMPSVKEPHFFSTDLTPLFFIRDHDQYVDLFRGAQDKQICGEASASYLFSKTAPFSIREFSPKAKIIIMLRDPVEMVYSLHSERVFSGGEDLLDFQEALQAEEDRINGKRPAKGAFFAYRRVGMYYEQVKRYLDVFGQQNVKIIIFDDFKSQPQKVLRETFLFLGVNPDFQPQLGVKNPNKVVRLRWLRNSFIYPRQGLVDFAKKVLPKAARKGILQALNQMTTKVTPRPQIPEKIESDLKLFFHEDIQRLEGLIGRELSSWQ